MRTVALLSLLLCLFSLAPQVGAQMLPGVEELTLSFSPQYPQPYDTVTVTVGSTLLDLASSATTISVNGKVVGEGSRNATFSMGGPGSTSNVSVSVKDAAGTHTAKATLRPAEVSLIEETSSTAHPFYQGARLPAPEGRIRLVALADFRSAPGTRLAPQNLVYSWKFGDRVLEDQSGIGKSVLTATAPVRYRDATVTVTVTTQDRTFVAQDTVVVSPVDPVARIYRSDPLGGVDFGNALSSSYVLQGDEETFHAVPYYFSAMPQYQWTLNGSKNETTPDITVRTTGASKGTAVLGILATDAGARSIESRLTLQFGASSGTGIFGL